MSNKKIEQWEVDRYWEIFSALSNGGTHLNGDQAASVLKNSQLQDDQLAKVWDLADVDNDGNLDFEEFCVAMRIIFDLVNGVYADVPQSLPDWLVPESKAHLVQAARALSGTHSSFPSALGPPSPSDSDTSLSDSFDWYMSPSDLAKYESIYTANRSPHGLINFSSLDPLYSSLDVPETDVRSAWNLVNPTQEPAITKHATLAFLHVLNGRHNGIRIPRTVPASLRASFQDQKIDYNVERVSNPSRRGGTASYDENTSTGRKAKFGEAYLSRLGVGGKSSYSPSGTNFSTVRMSDDWETVRLQRELKDLEAKISTTESGKRNRGRIGKESGGHGIVGVEEEVKAVKSLVEGLEKQWRSKEDVLEGLRREIDDERLKGGINPSDEVSG